MIFFSAHGVPVSYVEEAGDPYKNQMEDCIFLIMRELKARGINNDHKLAYQVRNDTMKKNSYVIDFTISNLESYIDVFSKPISYAYRLVSWNSNLFLFLMPTYSFANFFSFTHQSRVGPVQWLKPYTDDVLVELGKNGVKSLLAVPVR